MSTAVRCGAPDRRRVSRVAPQSGPSTNELIELRRLARLAVLAAIVVPPAVVEHGPVLCPIRRATGQPCPSCGLTRSWSAVAHGRLGDGFRMHPLGPMAFVAAAALSLAPTRWLERLPPYPASALPAFASAWIGIWLGRLLAGGAEHSVGEAPSGG